VDLVPAHRVVEFARDIDPHRAIFLAKIVRQIGPRHQIEPGKAPSRSSCGPGDNRLRSCCQGLDALNKVGVAKDALRFEKVQDLDKEFMHGCVPGSEPKQSLGEFERLVQILRTQSLGLGVRQIRSCSQGPRRLGQCCSFGKKAGASPASGSGSAAWRWRTSWSNRASWAATLIPWP
jgi:hypothetical protein